MSFQDQSRLIVALDVPTRKAAEDLARKIAPAEPWLKVGLELFVAEGPELVRQLSQAGHPIMLDLKLHDIPATVARAVNRAGELGVELLTIHASGGRAMLAAAAEAAHKTKPRVRTLAVTVLTSMDQGDLDEVVGDRPVDTQVEKLALLAAEAGCDGIVCSPLEAKRIRGLVPKEFLIVTPGVRPKGADHGDQKRVTTPGEAIRAGASAVVVGRPIRDDADPGARAAEITQELKLAAG